MLIAANKAVSIDYTLTNDAGEVIDSSAGGTPLVYLHGTGNIIVGLEKALEGQTAGNELKVTVEPEAITPAWFGTPAWVLKALIRYSPGALFFRLRVRFVAPASGPLVLSCNRPEVDEASLCR